MNYVDAFVSITSVLEIYVATSTDTTLPNAVLIRLKLAVNGDYYYDYYHCYYYRYRYCYYYCYQYYYYYFTVTVTTGGRVQRVVVDRKAQGLPARGVSSSSIIPTLTDQKKSGALGP